MKMMRHLRPFSPLRVNGQSMMGTRWNELYNHATIQLILLQPTAAGDDDGGVWETR